MSTRAKITLAGSFAFCGLTIWGVHYLQRYEKELMRAGLAREEERQQRKIQQQANKEELDAQKALHEHLIKSQSIKPTSGTATDSE
ncbi:hypothetical protein BGW37DRAFT_471516 [Umbelopsis sp. PMI_123]|nr:hypothetical protein BGW37DRAFT_471516 [Umbelopsis sp. PMI_123]